MDVPPRLLTALDRPTFTSGMRDSDFGAMAACCAFRRANPGTPLALLLVNPDRLAGAGQLASLLMERYCPNLSVWVFDETTGSMRGATMPEIESWQRRDVRAESHHSRRVGMPEPLPGDHDRVVSTRISPKPLRLAGEEIPGPAPEPSMQVKAPRQADLRISESDATTPSGVPVMGGPPVVVTPPQAGEGGMAQDVPLRAMPLLSEEELAMLLDPNPVDDGSH